MQIKCKKHTIIYAMVAFLLAASIFFAFLPTNAFAQETEENLFNNIEFETEPNSENIDQWKVTLSEGATFTVSEKALGSAMFSITSAGYASLSQPVPVESTSIYRIGCFVEVDIKEGTGGFYLQLEGVEGSSEMIYQTEGYQYVELYCYTGNGQQSITPSFYFGNAEENVSGSCNIKNLAIQRFQGTMPEGADYYYAYNVGEYEAEETNAKPSTSYKYLNASFFAALFVCVVFCSVLYYFYQKGAFQKDTQQTDNMQKKVYWIIGISFALGVLLSMMIKGHPTDMTNFSAWAAHSAKVGLSDFYISGMWADYPPGYIYVLYLSGTLAKWFSAPVGSAFFNLLIKLPALLADAACAFLIYRMAKKPLGEKPAVILCAFMAFNPMVLFDSAIWGQMDSVLTLIAVIMLWCYIEDKKPACAALFILGVLVKPQMLVFGPVLFVAYLKDMIMGDTKAELKQFAFSVLAAAATLFLVALPFSIKQEPLWLLEKYTSAAGLYPYASVNAFNLFGLLGGNWVSVDHKVLGISFGTIGNIAIIGVSILSGIYYWKSKNKYSIVSITALQMWGIFALSHSMHERYLFPAMMLFLMAYLYDRDKRLLFLFATATTVTLLNSAIVLALAPVSIMGHHLYVILIALINLAGFFYACKVVWEIAVKGKIKQDVQLSEQKIENLIQKNAAEKKSEADPKNQNNGDGQAIDNKNNEKKGAEFTLKATDRTGEKMKKKDYIIMLAITMIYAIVALTNLGSHSVPESYWRPTSTNEATLIDFGESKEIGHIYYYPGVGHGRMMLQFSQDGVSFYESLTIEMKEGEMHTWRTVDVNIPARYVKISNIDAKILVNELAFYDGEVYLTPETITAMSKEQTSDVAALFDEKDKIVQDPTFYDEMYFDEIYHARTAFEHLKGMPPYENTHPPLGKVFIMLGIQLFGMNPFGWRIIGTLFGIAMLPLLYVFAKRLFKRTKFAAFATLLFAADGMHFAQTRIATIDVYGVFFIIAMCYFMYRYWQMNFYLDGLKKTLLPLGLCGIMFGLGAASKWIGFYSGVGLAIAFFTIMGKRFFEYRSAKQRLAVAKQEELALCKTVTESFHKNLVATLGFCIVFFIMIPVVIYILSNLPYLLCAEKPYSLGDVWKVQEYMFSYHSKLTATHPFESKWYSWPVVARPIWYYYKAYPETGMIQSISSFGNPLVWWGGLLSSIIMIILLVKKDDKLDRSSIAYLLICLGAAFLPWVLISRSTYIYHYFASVPFIILLTAALYQRFESSKAVSIAFNLYAALCVGIFIMFYPVWSGMLVSKNYVSTFLRWFKSWVFYSS